MRIRQTKDRRFASNEILRVSDTERVWLRGFYRTMLKAGIPAVCARRYCFEEAVHVEARERVAAALARRDAEVREPWPTS